MIRSASIALASVLGVAGIAATMPAEAHPYVAVHVGAPRFAYGPYPYAHGPYFGYWHRGYDRAEYYRHGWDHFHGHDWDRR